MIEGYFDPRRPETPFPRILARVLLSSAGIPVPFSRWFYVEFPIDTGASRTTLHPRDALRGAGIPEVLLRQPEMWPQSSSLRGIGGGAVYFPVPATHAFTQTDGQELTIEGRIEVAQLNAGNSQIPSLLGGDILQHFKVTMDWPSRSVTLE